MSLFVLFSQERESARDVGLLRRRVNAHGAGDFRVLRVGVEDHLRGAAPRWPRRPSRRTRRNARRSGRSCFSRCRSPPARPRAPGTAGRPCGSCAGARWPPCRGSRSGDCSLHRRALVVDAARAERGRQGVPRDSRWPRGIDGSRAGGGGLFLRCQACRDEAGEQGARGEGLRLELGMELHADAPRVVRPLHGLHEGRVRGEPAHDQARLFQSPCGTGWRPRSGAGGARR